MQMLACVTSNLEEASEHLRHQGECILLVPNVVRDDRATMRILVRHRLTEIISMALQCTAQDIRILDHRGTAPAVLVGTANYAISFSHALDISCLAISRHRHIGVDIIALGEVADQSDLHDVTQLYLGPSSRSVLASCDALVHAQEFLFHWSQHEAKLKALGIALREWDHDLALALETVDCVGKWIDATHYLACAGHPFHC